MWRSASLFTAAILAAAPWPASAQSEPAAAGGLDALLLDLDEISQLSLADVLKTEVKVATATKKKTLRNSPGVLTVVTRDEIDAWGARDLAEVLAMVPGFDLAADVQGAVGLGFRGMWGHEGKVLVLVDEHEMNETLYLSTPLLQRFPVADIERVEIVRGPGSVIHGGYAELAVVNVVTRSGAGREMASAGGRYDLTSRADYSRRGIDFSFGHWFKEVEGLYLAAAVSMAQGRQSVADYTDFAGQSFSLRDESGLQPALFSLDARYKGLSLGVLYDGLRMYDRTALAEALPRAAATDHRGLFARASWEIELGHGLTLTPHLRYKRQAPYQVLSTDADIAEAVFYDKTAQRATFGLRLNWEAPYGLDFLLGLEGQLDGAQIGRRGPDGSEEYAGLNGDFSGKDVVGYGNFASFLQVLWDNPVVNVSAGARFEYHSAYGASFVPRLGLTKQLGDFHAKALYSQAFKAPGIENIRINPDIEPEKSQVIELEAGYLFNDRVMLTVNAYDVTIDGPIIYGTDEATLEERYLNYERTGTRGLEAELRMKGARGLASLSYALYSAAGKNRVPVYAVAGRSQPVLGLAAHKLTFAGAYEFLRGVRLGTTVAALGPRWGYLGADAEGVPTLARADWQVVWNMNVNWRVPQATGLSVGAGLYNLLGQRILYLQPYDGGHAPLPGMGRELGVHLRWEQL